MPDSAAFELLPDQGIVPAWCADRFGIDPQVFAGHRFWRRAGTRVIRIAAARSLVPDGLAAETIGMQVMRKPPPRGKPTSVFLQRFGATAHRNTYVLDPERAARFLRREAVEIDPVDDAHGYCVVRTPERVLGCGRVDGGLLYSEIPQSWLHPDPGA